METSSRAENLMSPVKSFKKSNLEKQSSGKMNIFIYYNIFDSSRKSKSR